MTIRMLMTEDSPTKVILQTNPAYNQERDKNYASSSKRGLGCFEYFAVPLAFILYYFFNSPRSSLPWYFWLLMAIFLIALIVFISLQISFINFNRNFPRDTKITIDVDSQRAHRTDKLKSGKELQSEIRLNDVSRVLIDCQVPFHFCKLVFESQSNAPFEVNSAYDFELDAIKEIGKRLGELLNKPVVLKWSEGSKVESEKEI